jgi:AraC-like DNA-binding protein
MPRDTYKALIVAAIEDRVKNGNEWPNMQEMSRALAMAPRTLQRRLREEGTTFRSVLDELRLRLAAAPSVARRTQADLSIMLGFAEASVFRRAFKRWTRSSHRNACGSGEEGSGVETVSRALPDEGARVD